MRAFRYYYFRLFKYYANGDWVPFFSTFTLIFAFASFNIVTLLQFISLAFDLPFIHIPQYQTGILHFWPLLLVVPFYAIFHYYLRTLGHHVIIWDEFVNETKKQKIVSSVVVILYFIFSIALFIFALWLRQRIKGF